jgi:cation transport ATPase
MIPPAKGAGSSVAAAAATPWCTNTISSVSEIRFVVEEAGCASCAALVQEALTPIADVQAIDVDESTDCATVRVVHSSDLSQEAVNKVLRNASSAAGHDYRVKPGSWRSDSLA